MTTTSQSPAQEVILDARALHTEVSEFLGDLMLNGEGVETNLRSQENAYSESKINGSAQVEGAFMNTTDAGGFSRESVVHVTDEDGSKRSAFFYPDNRNMTIVRSKSPDGTVTTSRDVEQAAEIVNAAKKAISEAAIKTT
jgi:hypothetical protein